MKEIINQLKFEKEKISSENEILKTENNKNQIKIFFLNTSFEKMQIELDNIKYDKQNIESLYDSICESEKIKNEKINTITNEKIDLMTKLKENKNIINDLETKFNHDNSYRLNEFVCKFCNNKQSENIPEHLIFNMSKK